MTNFEFYKDEILELANNGKDVAIRDGKLIDCDLCLGCAKCEFGSPGVCGTNFVKWLYSEHVERPKIHKRTKMFFDAIETGWVARDENGMLYVFAASNKPRRSISIWSCEHIVDTMRLPDNSLPFLTLDFIKWEDEEPWSVEDIRNLEVEE